MISYADTEEMREISKQLTTLANELDETFTALYARLSNVPNETKEWVGNQAEYYFETISNDKSDCQKIAERIKVLSSEIDKNTTFSEKISNELSNS